MVWGQRAFTVPGALQGMLVRRYCACGIENDCRCNLPKRVTGWTVERLDELRQLMREHGSLAIAARLLGETERETNLALDAMLGCTSTQALAILEAKETRRLRQRHAGARASA